MAKLGDNPGADQGARTTEALLVKRAQRRDPAAMRALVDAHKDRLFAFIRRMVRDHHDAEEVCQEAFLKAFASLDTFDPQYRFSTWLFTIGYRVTLNMLRRKKTVSADMDFSTVACDAESIEERTASTEEAQRLKEMIWRAVDRLSDPQKAAVLLFYRQQYGCLEIADVLEMPVATVKSHLHRARARLREILEPQFTANMRADRILSELAG